MTDSVAGNSARPVLTADLVLKFAAGVWLVIAVAGQWLFAFYIGSFYAGPTLTGHLEAWSRNKMLVHGYVAGDTAGNMFFGAHALLAAVITIGGAMQLIPALRARLPALHRWNGRLFIVTAFALSAAGLFLEWSRSRSSDIDALGISLNAILIFLCGGMAWRAALARRFDLHRRWALRTYLVANGQWFFRVGLMGWILANNGPRWVGDNLDGPVGIFWSYADTLLPLAVLELYLRVQRSGAAAKNAVAALLLIAGAGTAAGIFASYMILWQPLLTAPH